MSDLGGNVEPVPMPDPEPVPMPVVNRAKTCRRNVATAVAEEEPAVKRAVTRESKSARGQTATETPMEDESPRNVAKSRRGRPPKNRSSVPAVIPEEPPEEVESPTPKKDESRKRKTAAPDEEEAPVEQKRREPCLEEIASPVIAEVYLEEIRMLEEKLHRANVVNQRLMEEAEVAAQTIETLEMEKKDKERLLTDVKELQSVIDKLLERNDELENKAAAHDIYKEKYIQQMDVCKEAQKKMVEMEARRVRFVDTIFAAQAKLTAKDRLIERLQTDKRGIIERQRAFKKYTPIMFSILDELAPLAVGVHHVVRKRIDNLASEGIRELLLSACRENRYEDDQMAAEVEKLISHGVKVPIQPKAEKSERRQAPQRAKTQPTKRKPNMNAPVETEREIMSQLAEKLKKNEGDAATAGEPVFVGGTKTIHGQKSVTVREQQHAQLQKMSVKEKAAMMKQQQHEAAMRARREMSPRGQQLARDLSMTPSPVKSKESDSREGQGHFDDDDLEILDDGDLIICDSPVD